jgi:hypothetical protein
MTGTIRQQIDLDILRGEESQTTTSTYTFYSNATFHTQPETEITDTLRVLSSLTKEN